jgi:hypothetical protein
MARSRSTVAKLDPRIRGAVEAAIREGRASIDELVTLIEQAGGQASRSAVGRFAKDYADSLRRYREAQEVAGRWVQQFAADPNGDVGRLLAEMLKTLAFQTMAEAGDGEAPIEPKAIAQLARAVRDLAGADQVKATLAQRLRDEVKTKVAAKLDAVAAEPAGTGGAIPAEALRRIREEVYGIVDGI